ncbi:MAG: hypothetical protein WDA75_14660 [Candidatus Latescibacterota bacterium]
MSPRLLCLLLVGLMGWPAVAGAKIRSPHHGLRWACTECHTTKSWREVAFDHEATGFLLQGGHADRGCRDCHRVERFSSARPACLSCHADRHQGALGADCERCHDTWSWAPTGFDHAATAFPLWGAHAAVDCIQCHPSEATYQRAAVARTCYDCHERDFGRAPVTVHLTAGPDCQACHTLDRWEGGHDPAWFEIRGGHHEQPCDRCHQQGGNYASYTCAACHEFSLAVEGHRGLDPRDARCLECHPHGFGD